MGLEERIGRAKQCDDDLGWSPNVQLFVDTMDNQFCQTFRAWPAGCYVLSPTRQLLFIGAPKAHDVLFDCKELFDFLRNLTLPAETCPAETCPQCNGYDNSGQTCLPTSQGSPCQLWTEDPEFRSVHLAGA